jgi:hypothetical protein
MALPERAHNETSNAQFFDCDVSRRGFRDELARKQTSHRPKMISRSPAIKSGRESRLDATAFFMSILRDDVRVEESYIELLWPHMSSENGMFARPRRSLPNVRDVENQPRLVGKNQAKNRGWLVERISMPVDRGGSGCAHV